MVTIYAPATPPGRSAIAVVRISGPEAVRVFEIFGIDEPAPRVAQLATLRHPHSREIIDQALLLWFPAPHSFTGENTIELFLHGGRAVREETLSALSIIEEFRLAEPGEFSKQAFYNGKMDLLQAEAVADLIEAETLVQKRQALHQMSGAFSLFCQKLRQQIIQTRGHLEAYIDFPDEDLPASVFAGIDEEIRHARLIIQSLLDDGKRGERIREGTFGVILGIPNAGKSSLLNLLAKRDIAIVSDQPGTTRDVIEVHLNLDGYPVILADTAGLRDTDNFIEQEGIRRALHRAEQADFRIIVIDGTQSIKKQMAVMNSITPNDVLVINKSDLEIPLIENETEAPLLSISCITGQGLEQLIERLKSLISNLLEGKTDDLVLSRARHREAFKNAERHLKESLSATHLEIKGEELRRVSDEIGKVVGIINSEEILDSLFHSFCIGK